MAKKPDNFLRDYFNEPLIGSDFGFADRVVSNDVDGVRQWLDFAFHRDWVTRPEWKHMLIALKNESRPMLRLLATWGALPTEKDMADLRVSAKGRYQLYVRLLRASGVPLTPAMTQDIPYVPPTPEQIAAKIPSEWRALLQAIKEMGYADAVIAGGALRDIANGASVRDVDIFIPERDVEKGDHRGHIYYFFETASLKVHDQGVQDSYSASWSKDLIHNAGKGEVALAVSDVYHDIVERRVTQSWKVVAGSARTEYNLVFVDQGVPSRSAYSLISGFDIGLCQICYDGKTVETTAAYDYDVAHDAISLLRPNAGSREHLQRVMAKYPERALNDAAKALLAQPRPKKSYGTSDTGPR